MIPKILHFIWLGPNKPNYVNFAIDTFKKVNHDFEINFIEEIDIENPKNSIVKQTIDYMLSTKYKIPENKRFIGQLSIELRYILIYKYGGIYLDCDTFPIKPFDDKLLNCKKFQITRSYDAGYINEEVFFLGKDPNYFNTKEQLLYPVNSNDNDPKYSQLKEKFFNLTLKYGEHYSNIQYCYIDHFNDFSCNIQSKTCKVIETKYDRILRG